MGRSNPDSLLNNSSQACQQAAEIQQETLEAVQRIQLRAAETEVLVQRVGDVSPLIVRLTKNQGTDVPRSPQN